MTNCLKCNNLLSKRQIYYCSNHCKLTHIDSIKKRTLKKAKQDYQKLAKCKIDGKHFKDIGNYSGALSKHLVKLGLVDIDNVLDYYEIINNNTNSKEKWNCNYCEWSTIDTVNKSGCITTHIKKHGITIQQHLETNPEDKKLWIYSPNKDVKDYLLSKDDKSFIECKECNEKFKRLTKTHLDLHNLSLEQYRLKYGIDNLTSENTLQSFRDSYKVNCEKINKIKKVSNIETELGDWLESLGIDIQYSNRTIINPYELDLYLPEYKIAIEINGLYWHSENHGNKYKSYHLNKLECCEKVGVHLIQIFDDEWKDKNILIKNKILSHVKMSKDRIYARKCVVKNITNKKEKSTFLKVNHLQGDDRSSIAIGLYNNQELVAVMTFGQLRKALGQTKQQGHYELVRYCTSKHVVGGADKLFKAFLKEHNPIQVLSYADRRFTTLTKSTLYDAIGFKLQGHTVPNYWYTKNFRKKLHRYNFTKASLIKNFNADPTKSEIAIMQDLGYDRVWDCGNLKYVYYNQ